MAVMVAKGSLNNSKALFTIDCLNYNTTFLSVCDKNMIFY